MMVPVNRISATLALAAFAMLSSMAHAGQDERAIDLLRKSMGRRFPVNVVAVILQRDPAGDGTYQKVKVARAKDGRARHTILQPLRMAGVESIDDGDLMRVYLPDRRSLIIQDSPHKMAADADERITLAKKNYSLTVTGREKIAGRMAICVTADPKDPDMEVRRYYLDEAHGYPLRMEVGGERGDLRVVFDTKAVEYPATLGGEQFSMTPLPGTQTIRYTRPQTLAGPAQAIPIVGFRPISPERLPMGFRMQEMQYNSGKEWKSVVVRLSDGLVRATVYEWRPNGKRIEAVEDSSYVDVNGIRLLLVSDLPAPVRMRLLQAFASQATADDAPRAMRLHGALTPALPGIVVRPELVATIWAFAQLDNRAGLGDAGDLPGYPICTP